MRSRLTAEVSLSDRSASFAALAVQGPRSPDLLLQFRMSGPESNTGDSNPRHSCVSGPHRIHG